MLVLTPTEKCHPQSSSRKLLFAANGDITENHSKSTCRVVKPGPMDTVKTQLSHLRLEDQYGQEGRDTVGAVGSRELV